MNRRSLGAIASFLVASGCGGAVETVTLDTGEKTGLKGAVVRDHPKGAEIVTSDRYEPGHVFVEVDGATVHNAAHFRDLLTAAEAREGGYMLLGADAEAIANYQREE